jgi:glucose-1-phosphate adenylyltransferase
MLHVKLGPDEYRQPVRETLAIVLAGGRGTRLEALTDYCAKPAISFGGKFRVIDFSLSNCLNSGVRQICVLTQYKAHSLLCHLQSGWSFLRRECNEFIEVLPAQQRVDEASWYQGTADAVFQNLDILRSHNPRLILILSGDHVYKMDYVKLINEHVANRCPCTVACVEVPVLEASAFGVMSVDIAGRVTQFEEKPPAPEPVPGRPEMALASMGIYVFDAAYLFDALELDKNDPRSSHDFGKDLIPAMVAKGYVAAHQFGNSCVKTTQDSPNYWRDVGTVDSFWESNLDLTACTPALDLYDRVWPIWAIQDSLPPAKFVFDDEDRRGFAIDSLAASGCIVSGAQVHRSVLSTGVHINSFCTISNSVLLPDSSVGRRCNLNKVVVGEGCFIPEGTNIGWDAVADAERFLRTPKGVVLVTQAALSKLNITPNEKFAEAVHARKTLSAHTHYTPKETA